MTYGEGSYKETDMLHIRILVSDLVKAIQVLNGVKVLAAGTMYATFESTWEMRQKLTENQIFWTED